MWKIAKIRASIVLFACGEWGLELLSCGRSWFYGCVKGDTCTIFGIGRVWLYVFRPTGKNGQVLTCQLGKYGNISWISWIGAELFNNRDFSSDRSLHIMETQKPESVRCRFCDEEEKRGWTSMKNVHRYREPETLLWTSPIIWVIKRIGFNIIKLGYDSKNRFSVQGLNSP